ncbi:site-specific integrase [Domibacillus indicus]|uniref:site-specific integrase n=1 Tax=Domibacillus indicus TaxID=1437523 RepID=UPI000617F2BA|nr:tyrosine-type recombinase/integrase [Domibacillus indicus]
MKGSVIKRGETWTYIIDIGKDPLTGKRKQKTKGGFRLKKDAEAAMRKLLSEVDEGDYFRPSDEQFSLFIQKWFYEYYSKRVKDTTAKSREYMMQKHLIDGNPFSNKPISAITTEDIDALYNLKYEEEYSPAYIRKIHNMLNQAFDKAKKWRKIKYNPASEAESPPIRQKEMVIWSFNEIHRFLDVCRGERCYLTFLLALYTGMRRGELLGLKWSDIDFDKQIINVNRQLAYIPLKGYVVTTLKTKKSQRKIPISNEVIKALLISKTEQQEWKEKLGQAYEDNDFVICTEFGKPRDPSNVLRTMKRVCESAKVTPIRFHDLRHTHASILISSNVDIVRVAKRLGHADPKITLGVYAHLVPDATDDSADIFEEAIKKSVSKGLAN